MIEQSTIDVFRQAFLRAGGPIGADDAAIRAGLEAVNPADPEQCSAETRSWDHFRPEQIDSYWIRCTEFGPHDRHKDAHTGLSWSDTGSNAGGAQ